MKPDLILTADIHLREDQPVCRTDNYFEAQTRKLEWLRELQKKHDCPILDGGDVFNYWKATPFLLQYALDMLPEHMVTTPGNHDLPAHSLSMYEKSGLRVLDAANKVVVLKDGVHAIDRVKIVPFPWGVEQTPAVRKDNTPMVAVVHTMAYVGRRPYPGCTDPGAAALLKQMEGFDLVVTGHNHKPFVVEQDGRLIVNPGSLMRSCADQADHKPRVYLWYSETNTVEAVYVPIEEGVVSRLHIEHSESRDERIGAFVDRLSGDFEIGMSFEKNIEEFFSKNRVRSGVKDIVWGAIKGE